MTLSQRNDEAKGYWNHGYDTNLKSSLLFEENLYDEEDQRMICSSLKIVLREKEPGSTVKIQHDKDIANQARNDLKDY